MLIPGRAQEVFAAAIELPPQRRASFVRESCGGDAQLEAEVLSLLEAAAGSEDYFAGLADRLDPEALLAGADPLLGTRLGPWRLVSLIGRGGMGAVYLAERDDGQFEKQVAVKLLPLGVAGEAARQRFLDERRILARLRHEHIAALLDAGVNAQGTPYFVMDLVEGEPLDTYCDRLALSVESRLRLLLDVCTAVQYAHGKLVIHRDIKPGNVLVDASGSVRLLDFGIAKVLAGGDVTGGATLLADRPMTPGYASPEMLRGEAVDVRTDVYSLGVLMHRLLTGQLPVETAGRSLVELDRGIADAGRETASARVASRPAALPACGLTARQLRARLAGDLDVVVATALAHDPGARYASVELLARDLRHHLEGLPIGARLPTAGYRLGKFVRRHRLGVALGAATACSLLALAGLSLRHAVIVEGQSRAIAAERDRAERIRAFLVGVFESADPNRAPEELTARQIMDQGLARAEAQLADEPEILAGLLSTIADVYVVMRQGDAALAVLQKELALRESLAGAGSSEYGNVLVRLSQVSDLVGDYDASARLAEQALDIAETEADERLRAAALTRKGRIQHLRGDYAAAEANYRAALDLHAATDGLDSLPSAQVMLHLGALLGHREQPEAAEPIIREALRIREAAYPEKHTELTEALLTLGGVLTKLGRHDEAAAAYVEAREINESLFGPDNSYNVFVLNNLGKVVERTGDTEGAAALYRETIAMLERINPDHPNLGIARANLANVLARSDRCGEAEPVYREALETVRTNMPDHWIAGDLSWRLGQCLTALDRAREAEPLVVEGVDRLVAAWGAADQRSQQAIAAAVSVYEALGRRDRRDRYLAMQTSP